MRAVNLRVVQPEQRKIPWYQRRWAVRAKKAFRWLDDCLGELAKVMAVVTAAMALLTAAIVGIGLIALGILAEFVGGPRR